MKLIRSLIVCIGLAPMLFTESLSAADGAFEPRMELLSREAAQDCSPGWSEAEPWVRAIKGKPRRGGGKQAHDSDAGIRLAAVY